MSRLDEKINYYTRYCGSENISRIREYLLAHPMCLLTKKNCQAVAKELMGMTHLTHDLVTNVVLAYVDAGLVTANDTPWGRCFKYAREVRALEQKLRMRRLALWS